MLETKLFILFGICLAAVLINGFVIIKFYTSGNRGVVPIIAVPLTKELEPEFIVRNFVYRIAEECPETIVAAINFGAEDENIRIFEKLMEHSCRYEIIDSENCSESICRILRDIV